MPAVDMQICMIHWRPLLFKNQCVSKNSRNTTASWKHSKNELFWHPKHGGLLNCEIPGLQTSHSTSTPASSRKMRWGFTVGWFINAFNSISTTNYSNQNWNYHHVCCQKHKHQNNYNPPSKKHTQTRIYIYIKDTYVYSIYVNIFT